MRTKHVITIIENSKGQLKAAYVGNNVDAAKAAADEAVKAIPGATASVYRWPAAHYRRRSDVTPGAVSTTPAIVQ